MLNSVTIIGTVGQNPQMKYFDSGKVKTSFSVAASRYQKGGNVTDWFNVETWDKQAEFVGEYIKKGSSVIVDGRIAHDFWTDQEGNKREKFYIVANKVEFNGKKAANE